MLAADALGLATCPITLHREEMAADILDLPYGRLAVGSPADVCVFDPDGDWTLDRTQMRSEGRNTPFDGWDFPGPVHFTVFNGRIVHRAV